MYKSKWLVCVCLRICSHNPGSQSNVLNRNSHSRPDRRLPSWTFGAPEDGSFPPAQHRLGHMVLSPQASAPHCPNTSSHASGYSSRLPVDVSPVSKGSLTQLQHHFICSLNVWMCSLYLNSVNSCTFLVIILILSLLFLIVDPQRVICYM